MDVSTGIRAKANIEGDDPISGNTSSTEAIAARYSPQRSRKCRSRVDSMSPRSSSGKNHASEFIHLIRDYRLNLAPFCDCAKKWRV
jgi:hypothetical protein